MVGGAISLFGLSLYSTIKLTELSTKVQNKVLMKDLGVVTVEYNGP